MTTHTYAILEVSAAAYEEIAEKLLRHFAANGLDVTTLPDVIDMHGIALAKEEK